MFFIVNYAKACLHLMWWLRFIEGSEAGTRDMVPLFVSLNWGNVGVERERVV
jgi:hypothetical protein